MRVRSSPHAHAVVHLDAVLLGSPTRAQRNRDLAELLDMPTERADEWREFVDLLRGARDYLRYFDPRYARATRLVRRAYGGLTVTDLIGLAKVAGV